MANAVEQSSAFDRLPTMAGTEQPGDFTYATQVGHCQITGNHIDLVGRIKITAVKQLGAGGLTIRGLPFVLRFGTGVSISYAIGGGTDAVPQNISTHWFPRFCSGQALADNAFAFKCMFSSANGQIVTRTPLFQEIFTEVGELATPGELIFGLSGAIV